MKKEHVKIKFYSIVDKSKINSKGITLEPSQYSALVTPNEIGASYFYNQGDASHNLYKLLNKTKNFNLTLVQVEDEFIQGAADGRTVQAMTASLRNDEVALNEVIRLDTPSKELMFSMINIIIPKLDDSKRSLAEGVKKIKDFREFIRLHPFTLDILKNSPRFNHVKAFIHPSLHLHDTPTLDGRKITIYKLNQPKIKFMG